MKAFALAGSLLLAPPLALAQMTGGSSGQNSDGGPGGAGEMGHEYAPSPTGTGDGQKGD